MSRLAVSQTKKANYPGIFQDVEQAIGCEATAKLVAQYGGTRLYIPKKLSSKHLLCQLLGQEASQQLFSEFGGMTVEISRAVMLQKERRNKLIRADRAAGMSTRMAAHKYHLTERTIRSITNA